MMKPLRHLTGIAPLSRADIESLLDRARRFSEMLGNGAPIEKTLTDKIVITMFFEASTRTLTSFQMAALKLGASPINWDVGNSSLRKNETFLDTVLTLGAMRPDAAIVRHSEYGAPDFMAARMDCPIINAGDSWREHPTQALLDALTILQAKGTIDGLTVTICGDVAHSRVASSNMILLSRLGAKLRVIAPAFLMPQKFSVPVETFASMEQGLPGSDIVMMLRNQKERMEAGRIPGDAAFFREYGLTGDRLELAGKQALVMHPGPMNRNVEIADDVADDPARSLILKQVANGIPARMAALDYAVNG
ncbi:MAG TPA: aspartate carbamoyltransferase catalytic subunit [Micavibrio sp.]|jgi:aspartate carbamoyltransferase catalytic subunit